MAAAKKASALRPAVRKLAGCDPGRDRKTKRDGGAVQLNPVWFELKRRVLLASTATRGAPGRRTSQRDRELMMLLVDPKEPYRYATDQGPSRQPDPGPAARVQSTACPVANTGEKFRELETGEHRVTFKIQPVAVTGDMI